MNKAIIKLKRKRDKPVRNQHPWIFSGAIDSITGDPQAGDIVTVTDNSGAILGSGYWNQLSQIQVRMLTFSDEKIDDNWWRNALQNAVNSRAHWNQRATQHPIGYRLIHAENDYLPGLVVDRYGDFLSLQALTYAIDQRKTFIAETLMELLPVSGVYERSDVDVRKKEGLSQTTGSLAGAMPPDFIEIIEGESEVKLLIDIKNGHKTGFYLDQADNRNRLFELLSQTPGTDQRTVLNLFSYTGGFSLHALQSEHIHAINVDSSMPALELAESTLEANTLPAGNTYENIQADVFEYTRDMVEQGKQYDIVILDPPKFAHNKNQIDKASRGYKDINLKAFQLIKRGGYLMTYSCSGAITQQLFQQIVFGALADSGRKAQIIQYLHASSDHPIALTFPEGEYLNGLLVRVF